jgi:hypothetical protein
VKDVKEWNVQDCLNWLVPLKLDKEFRIICERFFRLNKIDGEKLLSFNANSLALNEFVDNKDDITLLMESINILRGNNTIMSKFNLFFFILYSIN